MLRLVNKRSNIGAMRKFFLSIFFFQSFFIQIWGQCITLRGEIKDALTGNPIIQNISVKVNNSKKNLGKSTIQGNFQISIPCEATELLFEGQNYKSIVIPIPDNKTKQTFYVALSSIPNEKQALDRPYIQKDTKVVIDKKAPKKNEKNTTRFFKVIDAESKDIINANVCLSYAKTDAKKCFVVSDSTQEKIVFEDEDIILVEVKALGFQEYSGNLYINRLDNKSYFYEISLSKPTNILAISNPKTFTAIEVIDNQMKVLELNKKDEFSYLYINPNNTYIIKATLAGETYQKTITTKEGLNLLILENMEKIKKPEPPKSPVEVPTKRNYTLYFDQSDFHLKPEAKKSLDSVIAVLQSNRTYKAQIMGFTDNIGDPNKNKILSEFRAKVSYSYLYNRKIPETRIFWTGLGSTKSSNNNETELSKNRKVEIKITDE